MSAIGSVAGGASSPPGVNGFADLNSQEFLEIIFTELANQDPLEPTDTKTMLEQLSSIRQIQSDITLTERFDALVSQSEFASAATLVGQVVGGVTTAGVRVIDLVVSVSNTDDGPVLNLFDGSRIPFEGVEEVLGPLVDSTDDSDDTDETDGSDDTPAVASGQAEADDASSGDSDETDDTQQVASV